MDLSTLDLNLLVTLDALLELRNVTETAQRFGITQPAKSHRLARIRDLFDDPLLVAAGLGREVLTCLLRSTPVPKSAFQGPGERPDAQRHFDTIEVSELPLVGERITLVDDFVTKGSTLLGAASRLATILASGKPTAFALVRTIGLRPDIEQIVDPCVGTIWQHGGGVDRRP